MAAREQFPLGMEISFGDSGSGKVVGHAIGFGTGDDVLIVETAGGRKLHVFPNEHPRPKGQAKPYDVAPQHEVFGRPIPPDFLDDKGKVRGGNRLASGEFSLTSSREHPRDLLEKLQDTYQPQDQGPRPEGPVIPLSKSLGSLDKKLSSLSSPTIDPSSKKEEEDLGTIVLSKLKKMKLGDFAFGESPADQPFSIGQTPQQVFSQDPMLPAHYQPKGSPKPDPLDYLFNLDPYKHRPPPIDREPYRLADENKIPVSGTGVPEMGGSKPPPRPPRKPPTAPPDDEGDPDPSEGSRRPRHVPGASHESLPLALPVPGRKTRLEEVDEPEGSNWFVRAFRGFRKKIGGKTHLEAAERGIDIAEAEESRSREERAEAASRVRTTEKRLSRARATYEHSLDRGVGIRGAKKKLKSAEGEHRKAREARTLAERKVERSGEKLDRARETYSRVATPTHLKAAGKTAEALGFKGMGGQLGQLGQMFQEAGANPMLFAAKTAVEVGKRRAAAFGESTKNFFEAAGSDKGGEIVGKLGQSMMNMGTAIDNQFVHRFGQFAKFVGESVEGLRKWNDSFHESNMRFAEFSAGMAMVQAKQEYRDIDMSRKRGDFRAGSADQLAESRHELNRHMAVIEDHVAVIRDRVMSEVNKTLVMILDQLAQQQPWWKEYLDKLRGNDTSALDLIGRSNATAGMTDPELFDRPPRFPRPGP